MRLEAPPVKKGGEKRNKGGGVTIVINEQMRWPSKGIQ